MPRMRAEGLPVDGADHFTILDALARPRRTSRCRRPGRPAKAHALNTAPLPPEKQKALVEAMHRRLWEVVPYVPLGQLKQPFLWRKNLPALNFFRYSRRRGYLP